jgi:CII-binding regulator of phage lambda lysogenization HflD
VAKKKKQHAKQGVCHTGALPFTLKSILGQKKNNGNSNISPCKNIIPKKSSKRNQNPSRYYISLTNLQFQHKPKYHISKILI